MKSSDNSTTITDLILKNDFSGFKIQKVLIKSSLLFSIFIDRNIADKKAISYLIILINMNQLIGYITEIDLSYIQNLSHICMDGKNEPFLKFIENNFRILQVNKICIKNASKYSFNHLDTAILLAIAEENNIDTIIVENHTENIVCKTKVPILTVEKFIFKYLSTGGYNILVTEKDKVSDSRIMTELMLIKRFVFSQNNENKEVPKHITYGEYDLFLEDQYSKKFHSNAKPISTLLQKNNVDSVTGISKKDGN